MFVILAVADTYKVITVAEKTVVCPVGRTFADADHRDIVHKKHNYYENRQSEPAVGDDLVDFVGGTELSLLLVLVNAVDDLSYVQITLVGDDALGIIVIFFLNGFNVLFNVVFGRFIQTELFNDLFIALKDLDRVPALLFLGKFVNAGFLDMGDSVLDRAFKGVLGNRLFVLGSLDCGFGSFPYALVFQRGYLNNLAAQRAAQLLGVDFNAGFLHNVHHVDRDNDGDPELAELRSQVQVTLQIGAVDDIQNRVGTLVNQVITRNDLLHCVRRKRVNTGQVGDGYIAVLFKLSFLFLNGDAGPVADELIRARQRVEQRRFAAVRVAR